MSFLPSLWTKRVDAPPQRHNEEALGDLVKHMVAAQMGVLRANILARRSFLKAQAAATDSKDLMRELEARIAEIDFFLGLTGQEASDA